MLFRIINAAIDSPSPSANDKTMISERLGQARLLGALAGSMTRYEYSRFPFASIAFLSSISSSRPTVS